MLSKNIKGLTDRPIMNEKTILTTELIEVLQDFLITEVSVEKPDLWEKFFAERNLLIRNWIEESSNFTAQYLKTV